MNKLTKTLYGAAAFVFASMVTTSSMAASELAGPYFGFSASSNGLELDGNHNATSTADAKTSGKIGAVAIAAGFEAGWNFPLGEMFMIDVGATMISGSADMKSTTSDGSAAADVTFEADDFITYYIAPSMAIGDNSSMYIKFGGAEADTAVTGDVTAPSDLDGDLVAIGTRTLLGNGLFIRTEAGMIEYDQIKSTGKGEGGAGTRVETTTTVTADPTIAYGSVSIGMKF